MFFLKIRKYVCEIVINVLGNEKLFYLKSNKMLVKGN